MTLADDLKPILNSARSIAGSLGLRPYRVYVVQGSWSGTYTGRGTVTETEAEITEADGYPPKVRVLNDEQIALGQMAKGTVQIGPITPDHTGGGTALTDIVPAVARGEVVHLRITGPGQPSGKLYTILSVTDDRALHYMVTAAPGGEL